MNSDAAVLARVASPGRELTSSHDTLAYLVHCHLVLSKNCRLIGISESISSPITDNTLPVQWNADQSQYCFVYSRATARVTVKLVFMGPTLFIHGINSSTPDSLVSLELRVSDYFQDDALVNTDNLFPLLRTNFGDRLLPPASPVAAQPYPRQDQNPLHDPLRVPLPNRPRDFGGDLDPFGIRDPMAQGGGGGLMGPDHPLFGDQRQDRSRGGVPRFDPFGPGNTGAGPDYDHFAPPTSRGPYSSNRRGGNGRSGNPPFGFQ